jgi:hypothetical protein
MRDRPPTTYPAGGIVPKTIGEHSKTMDVKELLNQIDTLEQAIAETTDSIKALESKRCEAVVFGKACYNSIYDILSQEGEQTYFAVEDRLIIINRHYGAGDPTKRVTIQPLTNLTEI